MTKKNVTDLYVILFLTNIILNFFIEWTSIITGKRACKYCGEEVSSEILIATDEYDDKGHIVSTYESLDNDLYVSEGLTTFTNSLTKLKDIFGDNLGIEIQPNFNVLPVDHWQYVVCPIELMS